MEPGVVVHSFNPRTQEVGAGGSLELEASQGNVEKPCLNVPQKRKTQMVFKLQLQLK